MGEVVGTKSIFTVIQVSCSTDWPTAPGLFEHFLSSESIRKSAQYRQNI